MKKETAVVLYMPALHQGCINFLTSNIQGNTDTTFLISEKFVQIVDPELAWMFEKDLRAVPALEMQKALLGLGIGGNIKILTENNMKEYSTAIIPDNDDLVEEIMNKFYPSITLQKENWFIRQGKKTVLSKRAPTASARISISELDKKLMIEAFTIAEKSSDWWRQVGVIVLPLNNEPIIGFNRHVPHAQAPYILGDPRTVFKPGECIELSTAAHAERVAIGYAAKKGIALEGASIYTTTFPCPPCGWQIKESGIKKVYYCEGYSQLNADEIFKNSGIELIFVDVPN